MKRNILHWATYALLFSVPSIHSCSKDSVGTELEVIDAKAPWSSDQEALAAVNAAFPAWQKLSSSFSFLLESATEHTISFEGADDEAGPLISQFKTDVNNWYPTKIFNNIYISIGEANKAIAKADSSVNAPNLSKETLKLVKARAQFIRGLGYLHLVTLWGEVPLITSVNPSSSEQTTRRSIDEVYGQIVKDLSEAEVGLPQFDQVRSNPSKGAANALLARAFLNWASKPLSQVEVATIANSKKDPDQVTWESARLQKVIEYADKVIGSGNYSLESDFEKNFGVSRENVSPEHIFTIHHDGDNMGDAQGNHQTHCPFTFRFDLYQDNHIGPADVTLLDRFDEKDKRKRFSLLTTLHNQDEPLVSSPSKTNDFKAYSFTFPITSPRVGKFIHRNASYVEVAPGSEAGQPNNMNRIEIRYAEVLLSKAEALLKLNRISEATTIINQLRQRAGLDGYSVLTQEQLEKEWYLELFFEQRHWVNLVRWRKLISTVLNEVPKFEYYKDVYKSTASIAATFGPEKDGSDGVQKTNYPFFAKVYKHLHAKTDNISGKFYRFPIPKGLSGNNLGITQNPGF